MKSFAKILVVAVLVLIVLGLIASQFSCTGIRSDSADDDTGDDDLDDDDDDDDTDDDDDSADDDDDDDLVVTAGSVFFDVLPLAEAGGGGIGIGGEAPPPTTTCDYAGFYASFDDAPLQYMGSTDPDCGLTGTWPTSDDMAVGQTYKAHFYASDSEGGLHEVAPAKVVVGKTDSEDEPVVLSDWSWRKEGSIAAETWREFTFVDDEGNLAPMESDPMARISIWVTSPTWQTEPRVWGTWYSQGPLDFCGSWEWQPGTIAYVIDPSHVVESLDSFVELRDANGSPITFNVYMSLGNAATIDTAIPVPSYAWHGSRIHLVVDEVDGLLFF